jgi:hypothetical protein
LPRRGIETLTHFLASLEDRNGFFGNGSGFTRSWIAACAGTPFPDATNKAGRGTSGAIPHCCAPEATPSLSFVESRYTEAGSRASAVIAAEFGGGFMMNLLSEGCADHLAISTLPQRQ